MIEAIRTAPADKSFTAFIILFLCGDTKSERISMAEFIASKDITSPMSINMASHSILLIFKTKPEIMTSKDITK